MKTKKLVTLANFNCTFKIEKDTYPMLDFFKSIILPAFSSKELHRKTQSKTNKSLYTSYYLTDIKLVEIADGVYALVGNHVKRTILDIKQDYDVKTGFIPIGKKEPSAPYSTFFILLNNHRVIYFPDQGGSPNIVSFASTVFTIVNDYIEAKHRELTDMLKNNNYIYNDVKYKNTQDFRENYLLHIYPYAEINIIPIESETLVKEAFAEIKHIKDVKFKFYKPNSEPVNFDNFFESAYEILDSTGSKSVEQKLVSPQEKNVIKNAISTSMGKVDYQVNAVNSNKDPLRITPDKVSQKITVQTNDEDNIENKSKDIYNQLKRNIAISEISQGNKKIYVKYIEYFRSLL